MGSLWKSHISLVWYLFSWLIWVCWSKENVLSYFWQSWAVVRGGGKSLILSQCLQKKKYWNVTPERALRSPQPLSNRQGNEVKTEGDLSWSFWTLCHPCISTCRLEMIPKSFAGGTGTWVLFSWDKENAEMMSRVYVLGVYAFMCMYVFLYIWVITK